MELQVAGTEWDLGQLTGRPATYAENARLALKAGQWLVRDLEDKVAQVVATHRWPGRFEVAQEKPLVLLDGAHNPAAAEALAEELQRLSGERPVANTGDAWVLVVGAGTGHDAAGILRALAPVAQRVLLTSSDHPRALAPAVLANLAPDGLAVEQVPASSQALKHALALAGRKGRVCVAGSLHLVARAREFFDLPGERDGITEDMALENLECIAEAGRRRGLICEWISDDGTRLKLSGGQRPLRFWRNKHPFNDYVEARLAEDKAYQYEDFAAAGLPIPDTLKLFNPLADAALRPLQDARHGRGNRRGGNSAVRVPPVGQEVPQLAGAGRVLGAQRSRPQQAARSSLCKQRLFGQRRASAAIRGRARVSDRRQSRRAVAGLSQGKRGRGRRRRPQSRCIRPPGVPCAWRTRPCCARCSS